MSEYNQTINGGHCPPSFSFPPLYIFLFCGIFCFGQGSVLVAEEPINKWAARPTGIYEFLRSPYEDEKEFEIRQSIPIKIIKIQKWGPPDLFLLSPGMNYSIEFHVSGEATLHAVSGIEKEGTYKGTIDLCDYARLCLLYQTIISDEKNTKKFGIETDMSHPVVSELSITYTNKKNVQHRNDLNYGDFRFWVFENVIDSISSKIKWKKVKGIEQ